MARSRGPNYDMNSGRNLTPSFQILNSASISPTTPPTVIDSLQLKITPHCPLLGWLVLAGSVLAHVYEKQEWRTGTNCVHMKHGDEGREFRYSSLPSIFEGKQCLYSLQIISRSCEHSMKKNSLSTLLSIF